MDGPDPGSPLAPRRAEPPLAAAPARRPEPGSDGVRVAGEALCTDGAGGTHDDHEVAALVARIRGGDATAFAAFHRHFGGFVHAVLLAHAPAAEVEDLHQEVFVAAWRNLAGLRDDGKVGAWLATIARNAAGRRRDAVRPHLELPAGLPDPRGGAPRTGELDADQLLAVLRELPIAYRETLALRLIEGMTGPEIAAATGLTHGSVRVNLHRGLELLREKLREGGYP